MPLEKPIAQRHYSEDIGNMLFITIPSRKNWLSIPCLGVWLAGWAWGEIIVGMLGGLLGNQGGEIIVFDDGAATIRFGSGMDEAEGKPIIAGI